PSSSRLLCRLISPSFFFFYCYAAPAHLHSFPTRRSSDLGLRRRYQSHWRSVDLGSTHAPGALQNRADGAHRDRACEEAFAVAGGDRKSTRLNSSHVKISYAVFYLNKKKNQQE